jgi:hypothetical protein
MKGVVSGNLAVALVVGIEEIRLELFLDVTVDLNPGVVVTKLVVF